MLSHMRLRSTITGLFGKKTQPLGAAGERLGAAYLKAQGYRVLAANYKNPVGRALGELDIVAREGEEIVFVEVKTRTGSGYGDILPETAISKEKLRRLSRIAAHYLSSHGLEGAHYRFDALAITFGPEGKEPDIRHLKHIFL